MSYLNKKTVEDMDVSEKKVFLRVDYNVPFDANGKITDTKRIDESVGTIKYLVGKNASIILCSHLGRPKGKIESKLTLRPTAEYLSKILGKEIKFATDSIGDSAREIVNSLKSGEVCMLENIRFNSGEETNDPEFAKKLASLADVYIDDAFGTAHRDHASMTGITKFLPSAIGLLMQKEISIMTNILSNPKRPFVSILGGAKVSDKIGVIESLIGKVDTLIVGGGMSYTFINAMGYSVGTSLCEPDKIELARDLMAKAKEYDTRLILPVDIKIANDFNPKADTEIVSADAIPDGWMGLDIGPKTAEIFSEAIKGAGTVVWNGPVGVSEWDNFAQGTLAIARAIAESDAISIIGGGDSAAAIYKLGFADKMTHISTGGGSSLRFLEGKTLPAFEVISDK